MISSIDSISYTYNLGSNDICTSYTSGKIAKRSSEALLSSTKSIQKMVVPRRLGMYVTPQKHCYIIIACL